MVVKPAGVRDRSSIKVFSLKEVKRVTECDWERKRRKGVSNRDYGR